jgi:hypothetical protein
LLGFVFVVDFATHSQGINFTSRLKIQRNNKIVRHKLKEWQNEENMK